MTQQAKSSKDRILEAAVAMTGENLGAGLSVRAVAARAGVSTGSLRHHFPTQRALQEAVLTAIYDLVIPDDHVIHDTSLPARDRLIACLRLVLAPAAPGKPSREAWSTVYERFIAPEPTEELRATYLATAREGLRRVEYWLSVLVEEGALAAGDNTRRARFLNTVVGGLSVERAMPGEASVLEAETEVLGMAVDAVLASREPGE
ncbi:TetR/AcrR family transcriptional regulator [Actinomycetospora succinea]|uniref:TetR/AcrR family transcriptional regulator n=1 Tax=Actinomycetospora succinea TaxID=663603 RepID=UPI0010616AD7|nr:TetR/AcrR family transcriptional regulator [Actinomycetospora succinea]